MSWFDGVPASLLYGGPPASWTAAAAASAAAQSLMAGSTGNYTQPVIPAGFWQQGKIGSVVEVQAAGILTGQSSATTAIITIGLAPAAGTITGGTGAAVLLASQAITVTSLSAAGWWLECQVTSRGTGYGTTAASTTLLSTGNLAIGTSSAVSAPTVVNTVDASVPQWLYATVTFSTSSATNSCQCQQAVAYGMA